MYCKYTSCPGWLGTNQHNNNENTRSDSIRLIYLKGYILSINKSSCLKTAILKKSLQIKSPGLDHVTNYESEYSTSTTKKQ